MTTSTAALVAALTRLDDRVLAAVARAQSPKTTARVVRELYPVSTRSAGATPAQAREVAEVLRGLERAECVHELDDVWHLGPAPVSTPKPEDRR